MSNPPEGPVRRDPRATNLVLTARWRNLGDERWRRGLVFDLSIGGALLACGKEVPIGQRLEVRLARTGGGPEIELVAEVLRTVERGDGPAAGVRFLQLTPEIAGYLAEVLNDAATEIEDAAAAAADEQAAPDEDPTTFGAARLSMIRLHQRSLYELLGVEPSASDGELESRCEALIASVARVHDEAHGRRKDRLRVLVQSLERMRPLWGDPVKRARYDLRWGYINPGERLRAAATGAGVHAHILSAIWLDLYPERVREAEAIMREAPKSGEGLRTALLDAVQLEPFSRRWRERLQAIRDASQPHPPAPGPAAPPVPTREVTNTTRRFVTADLDLDAAHAPAPPSAETPSVRGSLSDLPLRGLLQSLVSDGDDAEIELRVGGKQVGMVGIFDGDLVIAMSGKVRGADALRSLLALRDGTFVVRYGAPRSELCHMREPAEPLLTRP